MMLAAMHFTKRHSVMRMVAQLVEHGKNGSCVTLTAIHFAVVPVVIGSSQIHTIL